jgi:riboflavin kinase/FMN adenylyltransferase
MEKIYNNPNAADGCAVAIGAFDGFHMGHMKLIDKALEFSKENNVPSAVFTFSQSPSNQPRIITDKTREILLSEKGVDKLSVHDFTDSFKTLAPKEFFEKYLSRCAFVTVGFNFRFGKDRLGDTDLLLRMCKSFNIPVEIIPEVKYNGVTVSSTAVRNAVMNCDFSKAEAMLGREHYFAGTVVKGDRIGRDLGFPTANINIPHNFLLPPQGVYVTETVVNNVKYKSITNIGGKPTIREGENRVECYIIGFDGIIYGEEILIRFVEKIREIKKFENTEELKKQLANDMKYAQRRNL